MIQFHCPVCDKSYALTERRFRCDCGAPLEVQKEVSFPLKEITRRKPTLWRYREAIPIDGDDNIVSFDEGLTPLVPFRYKDFHLLAKLDYLFPSGSFKDRGTTVLLSFLKQIGVQKFVEDSSGNAGSSMAAYAAKGGLTCDIYCPHYAASGKQAQIKLYGARLHAIPGTRSDTEQAVRQRAETIYYASHNWNPFFIEGLKTVAFEIAEQLNWQSPDAVVCPLGFGGLFLGLYRGFRELQEERIIQKIPRLLGVQSEACCPIYRAFKTAASEIKPMPQKFQTLAEGVCAAHPMRGAEILRVLGETAGAVTTVSEQDIREGLQVLAHQGMFVEPTSAVVVKALENLQRAGRLSEKEQTVVILTGNGLKALSEITALVR